MSFTYLAKGATSTTVGIGHSFSTVGPNDIYGNTIFFSSFDLTSYAGADISIYGPSADGVCTQTETTPSGTPPVPQA